MHVLQALRSGSALRLRLLAAMLVLVLVLAAVAEATPSPLVGVYIRPYGVTCTSGADITDAAMRCPAASG